MWKETVKIVTRGELSIESGTPVYPYLLVPNMGDDSRSQIHNMLFHFSLWLELNPEFKSFKIMVDGMVIESPIVQMIGYPIYVFFFESEDRDNFVSWFHGYSKWFGDSDLSHSLIPELPNGTHTVAFVKDEVFRNYIDVPGISDEAIERWRWIIQNCKSPVYMLYGRGLAFTDETDGMHYKLRWI